MTETNKNQELQESETTGVLKIKEVKLNSRVLLEVIRGSETTKEEYVLRESNPDIDAKICTVGSPLGQLINGKILGFSGSYMVGQKKTEITIVEIN